MLAAQLKRIAESPDEKLSRVHQSFGALDPRCEQAGRLRAEAEQARGEVAAQAEAIEEDAANQTPTDDGQPWALQYASALFECSLAATNERAISRRAVDADLRTFDDGLGRPQGRPSSDSDEKLRDAPADGDLGEGPLEEDLEAGADAQTGFDAEMGDHPHPDVLPPAPREDDGGRELVGELEAAPAVDDDANEWMAAALDPDGCLEKVAFLARPPSATTRAESEPIVIPI
jgi:hypothetical protein